MKSIPRWIFRFSVLVVCVGLFLPLSAWGADYLCRRCHLADEMPPAVDPGWKTGSWRDRIGTCAGLRWVNRETRITEEIIYSLRLSIARDAPEGPLPDQLARLDARFRENRQTVPASALDAAKENARIREDLDQTVYRPLLAKKQARQLLMIAAGFFALLVPTVLTVFLRLRRRRRLEAPDQPSGDERNMKRTNV